MYVRVHVLAGSKHEKVTEAGTDKWYIAVKEKAEANHANNRVCEIVATLYHVPRACVHIVHGHHQSGKLLSIID